MQNKLDTVVRLVMGRAYIFTCSYRTAWEQYMEDFEKEGFSFEQISEVIGC